MMPAKVLTLSKSKPKDSDQVLTDTPAQKEYCILYICIYLQYRGTIKEICKKRVRSAGTKAKLIRANPFANQQTCQIV